MQLYQFLEEIRRAKGVSVRQLAERARVPAEEMADLTEKLGRAWKEVGCTLPSPYMTMASLSLACIPELRLTDRGLVDVMTKSFLPLIVRPLTETEAAL